MLDQTWRCAAAAVVHVEWPDPRGHARRDYSTNASVFTSINVLVVTQRLGSTGSPYHRELLSVNRGLARD